MSILDLAHLHEFFMYVDFRYQQKVDHFLYKDEI